MEDFVKCLPGRFLNIYVVLMELNALHFNKYSFLHIVLSFFNIKIMTAVVSSFLQMVQ